MRAAAHKLAQSLPLPYITLEITRMHGVSAHTGFPRTLFRTE